MNTIPAYKTLNEEQKQEADSRCTSYPLWAAINIVATGDRTADDIWNEVMGDEGDRIRAIILHWSATGQIDAEENLFWGDMLFKC